MLQDGETALNWAAYKDRLEVVKLLVKHEASMDTKDKVIS